MKKLYSGIGPRKTPSEALPLMTELASQLASSHWTLRSGRGAGPDQAFEVGVADSTLKEIYIPEAGFNGAGPYVHFKEMGYNARTSKIARDHHPYYDRCTDKVKALFDRNVNILLGEDADLPSAFVAYWHFLDNDIDKLGGTNHSLRIARTFNIPTFNLNITSEIDALVQFVTEYEV